MMKSGSIKNEIGQNKKSKNTRKIEQNGKNGQIEK